MNEIEKTVNGPIIPEDTMKEMAKFFMRTSIPRILAERAKEREMKNEEY